MIRHPLRRLLRHLTYRTCQLLAVVQGAVDAALEFGELAFAHLENAPTVRPVNPALAWDDARIDAAFAAAMPDWERAR